MTHPDRCHESVPAATRKKVIERDDHRCQTCGDHGPMVGGIATLQVHHIERNPAKMDEHDMANLTTLCRSCHNWLHKRSTSDDLPFDVENDVQQILLNHDYDILRTLADRGPATTGEICAEITPDLSSMAVRERLWIMMGIDKQVDQCDQPLVDQDKESNEWGLPYQIDNSVRGMVPDNKRTLIQRVADERVRQALERGCSRDQIADVWDIHPRTTRYMERRARAYDFPLGAVVSSAVDERREQQGGDDGQGDQTELEGSQQPLSAVTDGGSGADHGTATSSKPLDQSSNENNSKGQHFDNIKVDELILLLRKTIAALSEAEPA